MSACAMSYNKITRAAWDDLEHAAAPYGVHENSGSAAVNGFTVVWSYVAASGTRRVKVLRQIIASTAFLKIESY